jgi:hypothetical protein
MKHAFRAADLKVDEVAIPTSGRGGILKSTMIGFLSGTACPWALLVLGGASAGADEATTPPANLLYGPGSGAFAVTLTPAYQYRCFFLRGGVAWVKANNVTAGVGLGPSGTSNSQTRITIDAGILF